MDPKWSVTVERMRPESESVVHSVLEASAPSIPRETIDRLIADHEGVIRGLSLEQANHLMLKLHEAGVPSSKRIEAPAATSTPSGGDEDLPHAVPAASEPPRSQQDRQTSAPVLLARRGGGINTTPLVIVVGLVLLLGLGWYGLSALNRSAGPASVTPAPEPPAVEPPNPAAAMSKPGTWVLWEVMETYNSDALAGEKVGPPSVKSEWPAEIDLDRTACELVRQSKIRAAQQRWADSRYSLSENGVIFHSGEGAERKMFFEGFYCVAAPRFPPGHDRK